MAVKLVYNRTSIESHFLTFWPCATAGIHAQFQPMQPRPHRDEVYATLTGRGLEIGAFHEPAELPEAAQVEYFDAMDATKAAELFPEIPADTFVQVNHIGDIDQDGLSMFAAGEFDFVICNHVIEHVANPIKLVRDVFRITKSGGTIVLAAPDKDYTYDKARPLTTFDHLWADYENNVTENDDEHYMDFFRGAAPHVLEVDPVHLPYNIQRVRERRAHAHVWDSASFAAFLQESLRRLALKAEQFAENHGAANGLEHFSAWKKLP